MLIQICSQDNYNITSICLVVVHELTTQSQTEDGSTSKSIRTSPCPGAKACTGGRNGSRTQSRPEHYASEHLQYYLRRNGKSAWRWRGDRRPVAAKHSRASCRNGEPEGSMGRSAASTPSAYQKRKLFWPNGARKLNAGAFWWFRPCMPNWKKDWIGKFRTPRCTECLPDMAGARLSRIPFIRKKMPRLKRSLKKTPRDTGRSQPAECPESSGSPDVSG